jgi:hypothetical protein
MHMLMTMFVEDVEQQVCPVILDLAKADSADDFRTEAVAVSLSSWFFTPICPKVLA